MGWVYSFKKSYCSFNFIHDLFIIELAKSIIIISVDTWLTTWLPWKLDSHDNDMWPLKQTITIVLKSDNINVYGNSCRNLLIYEQISTTTTIDVDVICIVWWNNYHNYCIIYNTVIMIIVSSYYTRF